MSWNIGEREKTVRFRDAWYWLDWTLMNLLLFIFIALLKKFLVLQFWGQIVVLSWLWVFDTLVFDLYALMVGVFGVALISSTISIRFKMAGDDLILRFRDEKAISVKGYDSWSWNVTRIIHYVEIIVEFIRPMKVDILLNFIAMLR